uniref:Putative secreted protein n=1 Tax=Anopheles marajoara TaxID=58244 RepID=A0A2M4C9J0_9DIPT
MMHLGLGLFLVFRVATALPLQTYTHTHPCTQWRAQRWVANGFYELCDTIRVARAIALKETFMVSREWCLGLEGFIVSGVFGIVVAFFWDGEIGRE